jgi:hypothetical protein
LYDRHALSLLGLVAVWVPFAGARPAAIGFVRRARDDDDRRPDAHEVGPMLAAKEFSDFARIAHKITRRVRPE